MRSSTRTSVIGSVSRELGEACLRRALVARQVDEHFGLGERHAELSGALLEMAHPQPGDILHRKPKLRLLHAGASMPFRGDRRG